jgi:hypothetical protein
VYKNARDWLMSAKGLTEGLTLLTVSGMRLQLEEDRSTLNVHQVWWEVDHPPAGKPASIIWSLT